jgi:hypothetical protein
MKKAVFFWDYFSATGNIGAYLLYKELNKKALFLNAQTRRSLV